MLKSTSLPPFLPPSPLPPPTLVADKLAASLEAELKRLQKRRLFMSNDPSPSHQMGGDATAPATCVCPSSPRPKDQPLFTLKQVVMVCQRKLKEREEHLKEEFERLLSTKLAGKGGGACVCVGGCGCVCACTGGRDRGVDWGGGGGVHWGRGCALGRGWGCALGRWQTLMDVVGWNGWKGVRCGVCTELWIVQPTGPHVRKLGLASRTRLCVS